MMNPKRLLAVVAVAAVAGLGGLAAGHWMRGGPTGPSAGAPAAQADAVGALWRAAVTDADGKPQSLAAFKGHKVVVNFWASWCGPCVEEMPELVALSHEYAKQGIRFVGVGVDSPANVKTFLQKVRVDYPIVVSGYAGADLARDFGNTAGALPFTVVIDENGRVRATKLGQIVPEELKKTLETL